jgi:hypothetical protein
VAGDAVGWLSDGPSHVPRLRNCFMIGDTGAGAAAVRSALRVRVVSDDRIRVLWEDFSLEEAKAHSAADGGPSAVASVALCAGVCDRINKKFGDFNEKHGRRTKQIVASGQHERVRGVCSYLRKTPLLPSIRFYHHKTKTQRRRRLRI